MNNDILLINFLLGTKQKTFQLPLNSYQRLEAAGQVTGYIYNLQIDDLFFSFYAFVKNKYGIVEKNFPKVETQLLPGKAVIEQKRGEPGFSWQHLLTVYEGEKVEKIIFYPDICERENEEEDAEYLEDVKRAELVKSLVTTLPNECETTNTLKKEE